MSSNTRTSYVERLARDNWNRRIARRAERHRQTREERRRKDMNERWDRDCSGGWGSSF